MTEKSVYCEHVLASKELVEITLIAQDYGTTGRMMNRFLHTAGVQFPQGGTWVLYEEYKYKGYTQSKSFDIPQDNGTSITRVNTMWTQKGRMFLYKFLKEKYGALPIVERDENYVQPYGLMSSTAKRMAKSKSGGQGRMQRQSSRYFSTPCGDAGRGSHSETRGYPLRI